METIDESKKSALKEKLLAIARSEIRVTYEQSDKPLSALCSRIGGNPAVPKEFVWPYFKKTYINRSSGESIIINNPLTFMAQINLEDIAELDSENLLPKSGILSFFYELEDMAWGFDPRDKGSARVFYFPEDMELRIADYPDELAEDYRLPEFEMHFEQQISLPGICEYNDYVDGEEELHDQFDMYELYEECRAECGYEIDEYGENTKLLGYPDVIQNPMEEQCEMVTRGLNLGNSDDRNALSKEEKADIESKKKDWIMLFQMGTIGDDSFELMFGDCGNIYFWIRKTDLMNRNFDNVWLILQCG